MKTCFNKGWEFLKLGIGSDLAGVRERQAGFEPVEIPHDWLIYNTANLYEDSRGWYRKKVNFEQKEGRRIFLYFEGIYMDSEVYVNGEKAWEWKNGYSSFEVEITPFLKGGEEEILVAANHQCPNSRWYSGAGIYRDVFVKVAEETCLVTDSLYVAAAPVKAAKEASKDTWQIKVSAEVSGSRALELPVNFVLKYKGREIARAAGVNADKAGVVTDRECGTENGENVKYAAAFELENPLIWDIDHPHLYEMEVLLENGEREETTFGLRTTEFSPREGFFLNGRHVKLNGVCEHHDLGCLGSAYFSAAMRRKMDILKEMGVNAIRTSHNMPSKDFMNLADEMGILVVTEAFDMWERSKTTYDYARFFKEWAEKDVASWVRRDRNHPSVIMWSIGNEIYDTHADERGRDLTGMLKARVEEHDPEGNAPVTFGSNFMPWENTQKCADIVKLAGYNYGEKYYEAHHEKYPDWVIYGSETASVVHSRGIYHFPLRQPLLADDDEQCSALGNSTTSWGAKSIERCIMNDRDAKYSMGQFIWTGFDYIGEPTPYHTKNSYFGQIDTAGFPKDAYYTFKAEWTDYHKAPMIHVFPYWDFNPGQLVDVRVCSNAPKVELFFNGQSLGVREIDHEAGQTLIQDWQIRYAPGEILAVAYDETGAEIARESRHSFGDSAKITLQADKDVVKVADKENATGGSDLIFVIVGMVDKDGNPVENAVDYVDVKVTGAGRLIGLDNGDSTDYDSYKGTRRKLFSGKLLAVIAAKETPGDIQVQVSGEGLESAELTLRAVECLSGEERNAAEQIGMDASGEAHRPAVFAENRTQPCQHDKVFIRKIEILSKQGQILNGDLREVEVQALIYPKTATCKDLSWSVTTEAGITSPIAKVEQREGRIYISARADGDFMVRCTADNGTGKVKLISQLDFRAEGLGEPFLNPYEFVSGGLYNRSVGEVSNGNEKGVASARDGVTKIGFADVDFGTFGADEITLPIFALDSAPHTIEIWEGMPEDEGSEKVADLVYQKPSIWNVYQPETYKLPRKFRGVTTLCMVLYDKVHIKGFSFAPLEKAYEKLTGADLEKVYGDSFERKGELVENIGNNVTLELGEMNFGEKGAEKVTLCGFTPLEKNTIHIRFTRDGETQVQIVEFTKAADYEEQSFKLETVRGTYTVEVVFLPGSNFNFGYIQFGNEK